MTQLIIAKHRNGEICDIPLRFHHEEVRFVDESESTYNIADGVGSAMNSEVGLAPDGGYPQGGPFDGGYSGGMGDSEFNTGF